MEIKDYCIELEKIINEELSDFAFQNDIAQINAWRLNSNSFEKLYDEVEVYNKTTSLMIGSCILLKNDLKNAISLDTLQLCAKVFEYLSVSSDTQLDKTFLLLIAAFCYDVSGYQANAYCLTKNISEYSLNCNSYEINDDNNVIKQMLYILQGRIPFALNELRNINSTSFIHIDLYNCLNKWYRKILFLEESNYLDNIHNCYKSFLFANNIYMSNLLLLLELKMRISEERNIYNKLKESNIDIEYKWKKYIKNLANNIYGIKKRNSIKDSHSLYEFWISQIKALDGGLLRDEDSFLVQMPTSAGKSFIAELYLLNYLIKYPEKHTIYISPFRALASEKENDFIDHFENLGFTVSTLPGNYEIDSFQETVINETDLLIATPEKIDLLLRINKDFFSNISAIIIDEGHLIGEFNTRGNLLEFLIIRLRLINPQVKILFLSAVMPNINAKDFSIWLSSKNENILTSEFNNKEWQPTNKLICKFSKNHGGRIDFENFLYKNQLQITPCVENFFSDTVYDFLKGTPPKKRISACLGYELANKGNVLIFCGQVKVINDVRDELLNLIHFIGNHEGISNNFEVNEDTASYYYSCKYFGKDSQISEAIKYGIGVHYSDLPEEVKESIEIDYKQSLIKLLLCTSTLEQGVNLPIKNLIIHNLSYGIHTNENGKTKLDYISNKDFWNLVGRAGRAGKETEGKIFYVINSITDENKYQDFVKNSKYENVESTIYGLLSLLVHNNIRQEDFEKIFAYISDTYLIDLLTNEAIEDEFDSIIKKIIDLSLFSVQCNENNLEIEPIKKVIKKVFLKISDKVKVENKEIYSTGLSFDTTDLMISFINEKNIGFYDVDSFFSSFLEFLANNEISELKEVLDQKKLNIEFTELQEIIHLWITGEDRDLIIEKWKVLGYSKEKYYIFETKVLVYILPWILTAYILICCNKENIDFINLESEYKDLPAYLKYGVNNSKACILRSLGMHSRNLALTISGSYYSGKDFISYIANLSENEINLFCNSEWEKENLYNIIKKLYPKKNIYRKENLTFCIKGTFFNEDFKRNSLLVKEGVILKIDHDINNQYDPYALLILYEGNGIGYVPKEYNRFICTEMDLDNVNYKMTAISVVNRVMYNEIVVLVQET